MFKIFSLLFFFTLGTHISHASAASNSGAAQLSLKAKVIGIKDGDTVEVLYYQLPLVIRLEHIDSPEKKQPYGTVAKQKLSALAFGKTIMLISKGKKGSTDGRGRIIAELYTNEKTCLNKEMVKAGLAWHYKKYSSDPQYAQLEIAARKKRIGLWSDKNPLAPWLFRR